MSTSSDGVLEFLAAVHAADEQAAQAATYGPWYVDAMSVRAEADRSWGTDGRFVERRSDTMVVKHTWPQEAAHIARHDPQSVLARVQAERVLVELHRPDGQAMCPQCRDNSDPYEPDGRYVFDCPSLRVLAWGYRGREGFDPAWAPEGAEVPT